MGLMKRNKNLSYSLLLNVVNAFFPMFSIPLITVSVGLSSYGHYVYAGLITNILIAIFSNGLFSYYLRAYLSDHETLGEIIGVQFLFILFAFIIQLIFIFAMNVYNDPIFIIFLVVTLSHCICVEWYFYGKGELSILFYRTLSIKILSLIAIYVLSNITSNIIYFALVSAGALIASNITGYLLLIKDERIIIKISSPKKNLSNGKYFISNAALGSIYQYLDQVIISIVASRQDLAFLNLYKQLINGVNSFPGIINRVLMKDSQKEYEKENFKAHVTRLFSRYFFITATGCIGLFFTINMVAEYLARVAIPTINLTSFISSFLVFAVAMAVFIDTQISVITHKEKITTYANLGVATTTLLLMIPLVQRFNFNGGLLSLAIGETVGVAIMIFLHIKSGTFKQRHEI